MLTDSSFICINPLFSANRHFGQIVQYSFRQSTYNQKEISMPSPAFFSANQNHPNGTEIQSTERQAPEYRRYAHPPQAFRNIRIQSRSTGYFRTIQKELPRISLPIDIDEPALHILTNLPCIQVSKELNVFTTGILTFQFFYKRPSTGDFQRVGKL